MDHRFPAAVDLLAEVRHVQLDDVGPPAEVVAPHPVQDLRLGQHSLRVAHHEPQQLELGRGQRDRLTAARDFVAVLVEGQIADHDLGAARLAGHTGAPQQCAQPQHHLFEAERLGHVVVAARGQPRDPVLDRILRRQQQQRQMRDPLAQFAQHVQAAHVRQHHVEHHDVGRVLPGQSDRGRTVARGLDLPALVPKRHRHQLGEDGFVVDDQHVDRLTVGPAHHDALGVVGVHGEPFGLATAPIIRGAVGTRCAVSVCQL